MGRATTYRVRNGKLTPASARAARAQHEDAVRIKEAFAKLPAALTAHLGGAPTNGHAAPNGTHSTNGHANGTTNSHVNGHGAAPLQPFGNGHAGDAPRSVEPPAPATPASDARGAGGRFARGNAGGPGNPFARQVAARRKALLDAISPEDVAQMAHKLRDQALAGDTAAAKVLLGYVIGKTTAAADPDRLDLDEVRLLLESPDLKKILTTIEDCLPPDVAAGIATLVLLANPRRVLGMMCDRNLGVGGEGPGEKAGG